MASQNQLPAQAAEVRQTADYHPSVWGDHFIKHLADDVEVMQFITSILSGRIMWETSAQGLPEYLRVFFDAVIGFVNDVKEHTVKEGRSHCEFFIKAAEKNQTQSHLTEARWLSDNYVPTLEEYRRNGVYSSTYPLLAAATFCGLGELGSKEVFEWLLNDPKIMVASSDLARLIDDVIGHEFEQQRQHVASSVECYMKQNGVSKQKAYEELNELIESDWKDLNEELLKQAAFPKQVLAVFLNLARVMVVLYKDFDGYTEARSRTKDMLEALIVNPMPI
ncbi:hypothetical protein Tsubulata_050537 [Turnera subulata]|uniref:Terpene synthase metal-binding domain-containing protein n=1 Tax=Turnera subulata TaxID=218843 RepID=A0A9Q0JGX2_9ROSI|nr:hypothetical protein Tsubulata_050537 [Turnera subulata]